MKNMVVFGSRIGDIASHNPSVHSIEMEGIPITVGIIPTPDPNFSRDQTEHQNDVLIKVKAFSCNFRDKTLILRAAQLGIVRSFYVIGSEFVGEVIKIGPGVANLQPGDRVIGNNHYTGIGNGVNGVQEGLPTNHASKEYQVFHQEKLIKIPPAMSDEIAAAFSIGAQTSYSMIRKLQVEENTNILVTSAKSNTSIFAIRALQKLGVNVYGISTSDRFTKELQEMGLKELVVIDPEMDSIISHGPIANIIKENGLFDCVIDPFFDLHISKVIEVIAPGGKYITCGIVNQYQNMIGQEFQYAGKGLMDILTYALVRNIHLIGNCLGLKRDLEDAIRDFSKGKCELTVDSVFRGNEVADFINRTYNDPDRFGKVVYMYD